MMEDMKDETAQILSVKKEKKKVQPPKLYDLTTLQREANRLLGFTAQQTLDYTQSLYEKKLVTYPRTDSQYLTDDMEENAFLVIDAVNRVFPEISMKGSEPEIKRLLNSKKVSDHHAIIPTVEIANTDLKALPGGEKEILMLIASSYYVHRNRNTYMRVLRLKFPVMENCLLHLERMFSNMDGKKWKNGSLNHMGKMQKSQKRRKVIFQI